MRDYVDYAYYVSLGLMCHWDFHRDFHSCVIIQEHVRQHDINATVVKDLVQKVIHHRDFNANEVDHDMHQQIEGPSAPSLIVNLTPLCGQ